jgi:hypothetical protein
MAQKDTIEVSIYYKVNDMCKEILLEFMEIHRHACENRTIFEAWHVCGSNFERHTNWPRLMQLWQKVTLIPSSIAIYEQGFSKKTAIKSHLGNRLNLETLDALMWISLYEFEVIEMD